MQLLQRYNYPLIFHYTQASKYHHSTICTSNHFHNTPPQRIYDKNSLLLFVEIHMQIVSLQ